MYDTAKVAVCSQINKKTLKDREVRMYNCCYVKLAAASGNQ